MKDLVRLGCGAGFWGDSPEGPRQLVRSGQIDYLVLDYLAEITMSLLARARAKDANLGYATDFPEVLAELAPEIKKRGIKVVTNAGGVNPRACKAAIEERLKARGISLKIGVVLGDDLLERAATLRQQGVREMYEGSEFPARPWSVNAYLGAFPIAAALSAGADLVLTGRCVDSALVLGPLIHEFGWRADEYDQLAAGSLAGHIIECGTQATGGIVTDWQEVAQDWDRMGFPIAEVARDGGIVITKPADTGGRVTPQSVAEQIVYEVGDPGAYLLPDVICDFRQVRLAQVGADRVEVRGARGYAPPQSYKVSATDQDGFRATGTLMLGGPQAREKALAVVEAILKRTRRLCAERGLADALRSDVEVLGTEANWGANARAATREVILKLAVQHADRRALEIFSREFIPAATSMAQGITGFAGGRPEVKPLVRLFSFLIPKDAVPIRVEVEGETIAFTPSRPCASEPLENTAGPSELAAAAAPLASDPAGPPRPPADERQEAVAVPLLALAYGRSGDKGDCANIGVLARKPEFVPLLREQLTAEAVARYFAHFVRGEVRRYEWPGLHGFNFLMTRALGGGGMASLRYDPQGKMLAQILMDFPLRVPREWLARHGLGARTAP
ncbi:MAG: DUF1446 domain-containing protein [Nevskia sp.]|nr:DUF1446 domain-containing protein [Nevskia sp.]